MKSLKHDNGFSGVVPVEPNSSKPSKFNFTKDASKTKDNSAPGKGGRKIVDGHQASRASGLKNPHSPEKNDVSRSRGRKQIVNADDVDKLLENDAAALLNMKKEIQIAQENEMIKARAYLASLQKENNSLKISNDAKTKQHAELVDTQATLEAYIKEGEGNAGGCYVVIDRINENLKEVDDDMQAEGRTHDMMIFMRHRLEQEIFGIKSTTHELSQQLESVRSEYAAIDSAVRITRVELAVEEKHVDTLQKSVKERSDQRVRKMQQLQNLVNEGEYSAARAQESVKPTMKTKKDPKVAWDLAASNEAAVDMPPRRGVKHENSVDTWTVNDIDSDAKFSNISVDLTKDKIDEVVEWYQSKESRIQKLMQVQTDLKENITKERTKKIQIESLLDRSRNKVLLLASNRQMYQEVDMKDAALASARKEGDEFQEKDHRLKKNIEALRRSIPRFLQKIIDGGLNSSDSSPVPIDQLPDVVHKLEDEIARLIKQIGEKMLKDATQEDLANMSSSIQEFGAANNNDNTASETSRLHKLPGYNRLQKQLFSNLMSAAPDETSANVRVKAAHRYVDDVTFVTPLPRTENNADGMVSGGGTRKVNNEGVVDRATIKNISQLVTKRDGQAKTGGTARGKKDFRR